MNEDITVNIVGMRKEDLQGEPMSGSKLAPCSQCGGDTWLAPISVAMTQTHADVHVWCGRCVPEHVIERADAAVVDPLTQMRVVKSLEIDGVGIDPSKIDLETDPVGDLWRHVAAIMFQFGFIVERCECDSCKQTRHIERSLRRALRRYSTN